MSIGDYSPSRYDVVWLTTALEHAKALKAQLKTDQQRKRLANQLDTIQRALTYTPLEWGEPHSVVESLELIKCTGFCERLSVHYGVHQHQKVVFVRAMRVLPGYFIS